jgi:hypothetical protein
MRYLGSGSLIGLNNHIETMREGGFLGRAAVAAYRYFGGLS